MVHIKSAADLIEKGARERAQPGAVVGIARQIVDEHGEFIAGEAADDGVLAQVSREPLAQDLKGAVAGRMAEGVVDLLESVQIEVQKRQRALVAARACDGLLQQMLKLHAIGHLRKCVVARQIADAPLGAFALGDISRDVDVALELRVGVAIVDEAIDTGMVWPLAVRNTVSRASGAEFVGSKAPRCGSSTKLFSGLPSRSASA